MKDWVFRYLPQRKAILIAGLSIIISSLVLVHFSLRAVQNRHDAVKQLIQSNLRISGEAIITRVEDRILELEAEIFKDLNPKQFFEPHRMGEEKVGEILNDSPLVERLFALDANYHVLDPLRPAVYETADRVDPLEVIANPDFRKAEEAEFRESDYRKAILYYRNCLASRTPSEKALAQDGLARCFAKLGQYDQAERSYRQLAERHPLLRNRAQTPFGLTAGWQLHAIYKQQNRTEASLPLLLKLYRELISGDWPLAEEQYEFYEAKMADELGALLHKINDDNARREFQTVRRLKTERAAHAQWIKVLREHIAPQIRYANATAQPTQKPQNVTLAVVDETYIVAYQRPEDPEEIIPGFKLNANYIKNQILPEAFNSRDWQQTISVRVSNSANETVWEQGHIAPHQQVLMLKFNDILTSWKLLIAPAGDALDRAARREFWVYLGFLSLIVCALTLGIFLLLRDVIRESELSKLKADFVSNVSHELRTPLTLIRLYGETLLLDESFKQEERKEFYRIITSESERLMHLINNVLDFSRIDSGDKCYHFDRGDISAAVKGTIEAYKYHLVKKGFRVLTEIEEDLPLMTFDKDAIAQALLNLMNNALKYSWERKEVKIRLFRQDNMIVIKVADRGIGIAQEEKEKIFDKFYRARDQRVAKVAGSGLGLTLVKHIAEAHGGSVSVVSDLDVGSEFTLSIPIK